MQCGNVKKVQNSRKVSLILCKTDNQKEKRYKQKWSESEEMKDRMGRDRNKKIKETKQTTKGLLVELS